MVMRYDEGRLDDKPVLQPNGWLRVVGDISRAGVFEYRNRDGSTRRELRPPEEVMHADSLASFQMVPITLGHPGLLTADNASKHARGTVGENVHQDGDHVAAPMLITDAAAIKAVNDGMRQLSCGYTCDEEHTPGVWEGQPYDLVQRNIRGNHVAIVSRGRAGSASLRLDSGDAAMVALDPQHSGAPMKVLINGVEVDVTEAVAALLTAERNDSARTLSDARASMEREKARADAATEKAATAEKARLDAADPAVINAKVNLLVNARTVLGVNEKLDGLTDRQVQEKVLGKLAPKLVLDAKNSDIYVQARFDIAMEEARSTSPAIAKARRELAADPNAHEDAEDADRDEAAREKMIEDNRARSAKR